jgi:hypothetical protein
MAITKRPSVPPAEMLPERRVREAGEVGSRLRASVMLSVAAVVSMSVASIAGLVMHGLYQDPPSTASMLRGYDLVTLLVAVPLLAAALWGVRRGSVRAQLVWVGMLAYGGYNYGLYVFGSAFNALFLVHVAAFSSSVFAFAFALSALDVSGIAARFSPRTPVRWISGLLAFLALGLGGMWIVNALGFAMTGETPQGSALVETPAVVHLGYTLDLSLLVPGYALAAVLLWRRAAWGYLLAAAVLVSGTVHQLGYLVALPFQVRADVAGATAVDPGEFPIALAFAVATTVLLAGVRPLPAMLGGRTRAGRRRQPDPHH